VRRGPAAAFSARARARCWARILRPDRIDLLDGRSTVMVHVFARRLDGGGGVAAAPGVEVPVERRGGRLVGAAEVAGLDRPAPGLDRDRRQAVLGLLEVLEPGDVGRAGAVEHDPLRDPARRRQQHRIGLARQPERGEALHARGLEIGLVDPAVEHGLEQRALAQAAVEEDRGHVGRPMAEGSGAVVLHSPRRRSTAAAGGSAIFCRPAAAPGPLTRQTQQRRPMGRRCESQAGAGARRLRPAPLRRRPGARGAAGRGSSAAPR
jgi:hypothetical protein